MGGIRRAAAGRRQPGDDELHHRLDPHQPRGHRHDQDTRGLQGVKVAEDATGPQVYSKILSGTGKRAVLLLNRTSAAASITARWADMGLTSASASMRNESGADLGSHATGHTTTVPAGDAVPLTVSGGTEASGTTYEGTTTVTAGGAGLKLADITHANGGSTARTATLQVNGQYGTVVSLPPTGSATTYRTVSALVSLRKGGNTVTLSGGLDAVRIQDIPGTSGVALVGSGSGRCADINQNSVANGTQAQLWDCGGGQNQTFRQTSRGELVLYGTKCLDAYNNGTSNGTKVVIWDCDSGSNQKWTVNSSTGAISNNLSGLCLDACNAGTANGTQLMLWTCNGQSNQKWTLT